MKLKIRPKKKTPKKSTFNITGLSPMDVTVLKEVIEIADDDIILAELQLKCIEIKKEKITSILNKLFNILDD